MPSSRPPSWRSAGRLRGERRRSAAWLERLPTPPKLPRVLHDQRPCLRASPPEEAIGFLAFIEDDEQSRTGGAEARQKRVPPPPNPPISLFPPRLGNYGG